MLLLSAVWIVILKPIFSKFIGQNIILLISKSGWTLKVHVKISLKDRESKAAPDKTSGELEEGCGRCASNPRRSWNAKCKLRNWYYLKSVALACFCGALFLCGVIQAQQVARGLELRSLLLLPETNLCSLQLTRESKGLLRANPKLCRVKPPALTFCELW